MPTNKRLGSFESGFTLVELMIVVVNFDILAAVAIPSYKKYQAKARTSEVKIQLAWTYTTLKTCMGAAPRMMGFGNDDRFVVITDGQNLMNVVLYWRDAIPAGWVPATVTGQSRA